jgi:hypothetical protein
VTVATRDQVLATSPPFSETVARRLTRDTRKLLDARLLDDQAATGIHPAGLLNGVTVGAGATGDDLAANVSRDVTSLIGPLLVADAVSPVLLVNPVQALRLALTTTPSGLQFAQGLREDGTLATFPVLVSPSVPQGSAIAMDVDGLVIAGRAVQELLVSEEATLHMEDTTPLPLNDGTAATPVRSLFQTASIGIRLLWQIDWGMTRPGLVTALDEVNW